MFEYKKIKNNHTGSIKVVSIYVLIQIVNRVSIFNMHYKACMRVYIKELRINDVINATEKEKLERILIEQEKERLH